MFITAAQGDGHVLSAIVTPLSVATPPRCFMAAPGCADELPLMVTFLSVTSPSVTRPPPAPADTFPLSVTRLRDAVPEFR